MFTGAVVVGKVDASARRDFYSSVSRLDTALTNALRELEEVRRGEFDILEKNGPAEQLVDGRYGIAQRVLRLRELRPLFEQLEQAATVLAGKTALESAGKGIVFVK